MPMSEYKIRSQKSASRNMISAGTSCAYKSPAGILSIAEAVAIRMES